MKKNRILLYLLSFSIMIITSFRAQAQCDYNLTVVEAKISDCWSNGIVQATIWGPNVDNGNIQLHDAEFSIESVTPGGYTMAFSKNGGTIQNVPPGTYVVTARATCKNANWEYKVSAPVTVTGTYIEVNTNNIQVETAKTKDSKACLGTGSVSIKMQGGGKEPFKIIITSAPAGYTGPMQYDSLSSGSFVLTNLYSGNYTFEWVDDCGKSYSNLHETVGIINPIYTAIPVSPSRTCAFEGSIKITADKGLEPYKAIITWAPAAYPNPLPDTILMAGTDTLLTNLPHGNYSITVEDDCGYSKSFTPKISEIKFANPNPPQITKSTACDSTGSFSFNLKNGVPPYQIDLVNHPATYNRPTSFIQNSDGLFSLTNLASGYYKFQVKDSCNVTYIVSGTVDVDTMSIRAVATTKSQTCVESGSVTLQGLSGGQDPYTVEMTSYPAGYAGPYIFSPVNAGNYTINNVPAGDYEFRITDACPLPFTDTLIVTATVDTAELDVQVSITSSSLACLATGELTVWVDGGVPPYLIILDSVSGLAWPGGSLPHPDTTHLSAPGVIVLDSLPNGKYQIVVIDSCGVSDTADFTKTDIIAIWDQIPDDPFEEYFYQPTAKDPACQDVRIKRKKVTGNPGNYWNQHSEDYYEVMFIYKGDTTAWQPVTEYIDYSIFTSYKEMRDTDWYVEAIVRLKGDVDTCALFVLDTIRLDSVYTNVTATANQCSGFNLRFNQKNGQNSIFCYPYKWYLVHGSDTIRKKTTGVNTDGTQNITNILPYGDYTIHFEDKEGWKWSTDFTVDWTNPNTDAQINYHDFYCNTYSITFTPDICLPYHWKILDSATMSVVHDYRDTVTTNANQTSTGLIYNNAYVLRLIDNLGDTTNFPIKYTRTNLFDFDISYNALSCYPDLGKGSIKIFRNGGTPVFPVGTRIRYVSGPTIPKHADTTLTSLSSGVTEFYPFTSDSMFTVNSYDSIIAEGIYKFEITDTCGVTNLLTINYEFYKAGNFAYTEISKCTGARIFPTGDIWLGNTPQTPWFRIKSAPSGILVNTASVTTGGFLFLPESGKYVIQMSLENSTTSCPIDTIEIDFTKKTVMLDADATVAYICDTINPGYIFVRAIGGEGPYKFELFDQGVLVGSYTAPLGSGDCEFQYGSLGETYLIKVTDLTCGVSFPQHVTMLDISEQRFIFGTEHVCVGDQIQLNSISISQTYLWQGPGGYTSNLQNPVINDATLAMTGNYVIEVKPGGCLQPIHQTIEVTVHQPVTPTGDTINIVCLNTTPSPWVITPSPAHTIQWYDTDGTTRLSTPPVPPTHAVDTITYYVSQISDTLGCESLKMPMVAIISDLPDPAVNPYSPVVCAGEIPTIILPVTDSAYTYIVYDAITGGDSITSGIGTGDTVRMQGTVAVWNTTNYYIEILNAYHCPGLARTEVRIPIQQPPPMPDADPVKYVCLNVVADTLQATALPDHHLQWYDIDGTTPLLTAPVPPTHAVDTIIYYVSQINDTLGCESAKRPVKVIISDLPGLVPNPSAQDICPGEKPTINIPATKVDYTYQIYTDSIGGVFLVGGRGDGSTLSLFVDSALMYSTTFYIEVYNEYMCQGLDRTPVNVTIVDLPIKPHADTVNIMCLYSTPPQLQATALAGHHLQWYAPDGVTPLPNAPYPPTHAVDTITYYVAQIRDDFGCEGDKLAVTAIISDLPDSVAFPVSPDICPGMYPVININRSFVSHTYNVYTRETGGNLVGTMIGTGGAITIPTDEPVMSSTTYYIEVLNENQCAGLQRTAVNINVVNYVWIKPDIIPPYERGVPYNVQLQTNAAPPYVFSLPDGPLPLGFQLSSQGLITGSAPANGKIDPSPFRVMVVDNDGCVAIKEYELKSDIFAPEAFTPNGDGVNDHFMKGKRLIVFDRLGVKIFEGDDGWDGSYNGKPAPADTYFYIIYYVSDFGEHLHKTGYITLLRRN